MAPKGAAKNEDLTVTKLFDVSNFAAVVTGGGTGIGLMITQALVANGARVYIVGRRSDPLESVVEKYSTGPGKIIALVFHGLSICELGALQLHQCSP
jgi:NAD(P)-dependent dehydrogenase (short-subunit alcohol dehydrogenase family)